MSTLSSLSKWILLVVTTILLESRLPWSVDCFTFGGIRCCGGRHFGFSHVVNEEKRLKLLDYGGVSQATISTFSSSSSSSSLYSELNNNYTPRKVASSKSTTAVSRTSTANPIFQAAANLTETSSPLLGIKSLGIDYGLARTGLAITVGYSPKPLTILPSENITQLCTQILQTVENERVERIVLGLPFHKNGTESNQTKLTREFADVLVCEVAKRFGLKDGVHGRIPLYLWDERYTSKEAAARAKSVNPRVDLYKNLDAEAACIILEYYYVDGGLGSEEVKLPEDVSVREEVERVWAEGREKRERERDIWRQNREDRLNAKQLAIDRSKELEKKLAAQYGNIAAGKKGKRKKKRRKKRGTDDKKRIIL